MSERSWYAYDRASERYFDIYESLSFTEAHQDLLSFLPLPGTRCLDVGAGSGRDAAALAKIGYKVTAVEPSDGLRSLAEQRHHSLNIIWISDSLPNLVKLQTQPYRYDFILLSAVWMHIAPEERLGSLQTLKHLLSENGKIALSLRLGPPSIDRVMYAISLDELVNYAKKIDLFPVYVSKITSDSLSRRDVRWQNVVLQTGKI